MRRVVATFIAVYALVAAACGAGADTPAQTSDIAGASVASPTTTAAGAATPPTTERATADSFPATVVADNGEVTVPARPEAIVSLSPTATEMLFAIGAGQQIVAADSLSDYPAEAPTTALSAFEPNIEAIAEFNPDLVVLSFDPGDVVTSLEVLGIPTLVQGAAASINDSFEQMRQLGTATGSPAGATTAIRDMERAIDALADSIPAFDQPIRYYHELDNTYYSAASSTFIGEVYGLLGMESIADGAGELNVGYPQLSAEFILEADPDIILLADTKCCDQDAVAVSQRPGWDRLSAVSSGAIVELDDDIASRWGPRIVDLLADVAAALVAMSESG